MRDRVCADSDSDIITGFGYSFHRSPDAAKSILDKREKRAGERLSNVDSLIARSRGKMALLEFFADKYIWWESPEEILSNPLRVIAQVMDIGTGADLVVLVENFSESLLREVILESKPGWFRPRSWHYWHYKLNLADDETEIPSLPEREFSREVFCNE